MSPIFVRPAREQDEHDRLVRFLQAKYAKKFEVGANHRDEQAFPVKIGQNNYFPDLVLLGDSKRPQGLVEVETAESINNLEAMHQWVQFSKARVPFHLYVPATPVQAYDNARRLCDTYQANVTEVWTYRGVTDGFDLVRVYADPGAASGKRESKAPAASKGTAKRATSSGKPAAPPAKAAKKKPAAPARKAAPAGKKPAARPAARKATGAKAKPKAAAAARSKAKKR